jgi:hypothetical protein
LLEKWLQSPPQIYVTDKSSKDFDVTSGVDEKIFTKNLNVLVNIRRETFKDKSYADEKSSQTQYFVAVTVLAWFWSLGISVEILKNWLLSFKQDGKLFLVNATANF